MANTHSTALNGSTQYWSITDASQTGLDFGTDFTIEMWAKTTDVTHVSGMAGKMSSGSGNFSFQWAINGTAGSVQNFLFLSSNGTSSFYDSSSDAMPVQNDEWNHYAITRSGTSLKYYFNGQQLGSTVTLSSGSALYDGTAAFEIGRDGASANREFEGNIDDVRVWSDERTSTEILDNMTTELNGDEAGLVGYWKFNNDGTDSTSNGNDLTNNNSATFSTDIPVWSGNTFATDLEAGSSQSWSVADNAALRVDDGWTVECWIKPESLVNGYILNARSGENGWGLGINTSGNVLVYAGSGAFGNTTSTATLSAGTWYHIAVYFNGASTKLYINGGAAETLSNAAITNPNTTVYFGRKATSADTFYDGLLDEVRFWNDERTSTEILENMQSELVGDEAGLEGYWKFNADGTDSTSNSNDLTNNNSATFTTDASFQAKSTDLESGSSQYWSVADDATLSQTGDISVEAWIKLESQPGTDTKFTIASKYTTTGNQRSWWFSYRDFSGTKKLNIGYGADGSARQDLSVTQTLSNDTWYHVAVTLDVSAKTAEFFVDGASIGSDTAGTQASIYDGTAAFKVGADDASYFDGLIDEVRYWSDIRTAAEIDDNKCTTLTGTEANLVGYWRFDNNSVDQSGNGNALTNNNTAIFSTDNFTDASTCAVVASTENALSWCNF